MTTMAVDGMTAVTTQATTTPARSVHVAADDDLYLRLSGPRVSFHVIAAPGETITFSLQDGLVFAANASPLNFEDPSDFLAVALVDSTRCSVTINSATSSLPPPCGNTPCHFTFNTTNPDLNQQDPTIVIDNP